LKRGKTIPKPQHKSKPTMVSITPRNRGMKFIYTMLYRDSITECTLAIVA